MAVPLTRRTGRRITPLDAGVVLALAGLAAWIAWRVLVGLEYNWNWGMIPQYLLFRADDDSWRMGMLLQGLVATVRLSLWAGVLAMLLGTAAGLARVGCTPLKRLVGGAYVGLVRNTPPLVLVFVFYFFLGDQLMLALGVEDWVYSLSDTASSRLGVLFGPMKRAPQFFSAVLALCLFEGAYIAEIVRAGVESVDRSQWDASAALGMTRRAQLRHIVLPQALQRMLPALAGQFISTIKDSAIVAVISVQELTFQGMELMAATYRTFEVWITVTAMYFVLTFACSLLVRRLEARLTRG